MSSDHTRPDVLRAAVASVPLTSEPEPENHEQRTSSRSTLRRSKTRPQSRLTMRFMEKTARAAVVPCTIGWSDVGNWNALWDLGAKDAAGNVLVGDAVAQESANTFLRSDGPLVVGVGLEDIVVVATDDAVLVGHQSQVKSVNKAVDRLAAERRRQASEHERSYRTWGYVETIERGPRFRVQRLSINPGMRTSLQKHFHRAEHWVVVEGSAIVTRNDEELLLSENEAAYLPLGTVHRIANPGNVVVTMSKRSMAPI